jgi:hypothetical protein
LSSDKPDRVAVSGARQRLEDVSDVDTDEFASGRTSLTLVADPWSTAVASR